METIKIDIINSTIIKTFTDNSRQYINVSSLTGSNLTLFNQCVVCVNEKFTEYEFISLNIDAPVTRLVYFFNAVQFKAYSYDELPVEAQNLFTQFITMCNLL